MMNHGEPIYIFKSYRKRQVCYFLGGLFFVAPTFLLLADLFVYSHIKIDYIIGIIFAVVFLIFVQKIKPLVITCYDDGIDISNRGFIHKEDLLGYDPEMGFVETGVYIYQEPIKGGRNRFSAFININISFTPRNSYLNGFFLEKNIFCKFDKKAGLKIQKIYNLPYTQWITIFEVIDLPNYSGNILKDVPENARVYAPDFCYGLISHRYKKIKK